MIGSDDLAQMQADLLAVRDDNDVSVVFRRGDTTLPAQTVRVARVGGSVQDLTTERGAEQRGRVIVVGSTTLDVAVGDRFTVSGILYRVTFVRPNRTAATVAEAEAVE